MPAFTSPLKLFYIIFVIICTNTCLIEIGCLSLRYHKNIKTLEQ